MRFPRWRKMTWVVVIFNILMLVWLVAGLGAAADTAQDCVGEEFTEACEAGVAVGTTVAAGFIMVLWFLGNGILGILWLVTRPKTRDCPVCGEDVKRGVTRCKSCGHDFAVAATTPPSDATPSPPI